MLPTCPGAWFQPGCFCSCLILGAQAAIAMVGNGIKHWVLSQGNSSARNMHKAMVHTTMSCMHPAWLWKPLELWHVEATWSSQLKDNWLKSTECSTKKNTHVHASCSCKHHVLYANQQLEKALHANAKMGKGTCFSPLHDVLKIMLPGISHRNK